MRTLAAETIVDAVAKLAMEANYYLDPNAIKAFEEGMKITRFCKEKLGDAESRLQKLVKDADGDFQLDLLE